MTKKKSYSKVGLQREEGSASAEIAEAEQRPGGMVVQKRDGDTAGVSDQSTKEPFQIKVSYGSSLINLNIPPTSTFGDVKGALAQETGLEPCEQRLFYRGIEKEENVSLSDAGVKNLSKLLLREVEATKEKKLEEMKRKEEQKLEEMKKREEIARACEAVSRVEEEVNQLSEKVDAIEGNVLNGTKVQEKEFLLLEELLMRQLLKLDGIKVEGEAKEVRKREVRRIQGLEKKLETLKQRDSNPISINNNTVSITTQWETYDSGVGSLNPPPAGPSSPTQDWEQFD